MFLQLRQSILKNLTEIFKEDKLPSVHQQNGNITVLFKIFLPLLPPFLCMVDVGYCCGLTWKQLSTMQPYVHPPSGKKERIAGEKRVELVGWDKNYLVGQKRKDKIIIMVMIMICMYMHTNRRSILLASLGQLSCSVPSQLCAPPETSPFFLP